MDAKVSIDWPKATVHSNEGGSEAGLQLWLYLTGTEPDDHFYAEFKRLSQRRQVEARGEAWGRIELAGANAIVVNDVTPASESDLRSELDQLLETANREAARARKGAADAAREDERQRAQSRRAAAEMTTRLRDAY